MTNETAIQILQQQMQSWKDQSVRHPQISDIFEANRHVISELEAAADNISIRAVVEKELDKEVMLRKKYEVSSDRTRAFKHSHRAAAFRDLLKKIVILLLISGGLQAQKRDNFWLKQGISAATMLTAGFLQGSNEVAVNDYRRFAARHPNANPKWANSRISFKRKYKDFPTDKRPAYFGSTTFLAWTSDRHHLYNTTRNFLVAGNIGITMSLYEKPNWKQIVLQAATSWAAFAVGSGAAHAYYKPIN